MAKEKKSVSAKYTTKKGSLVGFISILEPSSKFNKDGVYQANILLSKEEGEALAAKIKEVRTEQFKTYGKGTKVVDITQCVPYTKVNDEGEEIADPQERYILKTKATAFIKEGKPTVIIPVLDSKLKPIKDVRIGEGTVAKLAIDLVGYSVAGKTGVSIKLKLVQIIDLVEYAGGASAEAYGLTEEDGFDVNENKEPSEDTLEDGEEEELDF